MVAFFSHVQKMSIAVKIQSLKDAAEQYSTVLREDREGTPLPRRKKRRRARLRAEPGATREGPTAAASTLPRRRRVHGRPNPRLG